MRKVAIVLVVATLLLVLGAQAASASDQLIHVVKQGETLAQIARRYGTSVQAIASANGIHNPSHITVGQQLIIPTHYYPDKNPPGGGGWWYIVHRGDTLSGIAQQYDISTEALVAANGLVDPDVLQIGQVLIIPEEDSTAVPVDSETAPTIASGTSEAEDEPAPPTLTPSGPPLVGVARVESVSELEVEALLLKNEGGTVSVERWRLSGTSGASFEFPALTLFPGGEVWIVTSTGEDTPRRLYWGRTEPAWSPGELITLRDADGNIVDTFIVPE